jgi:hypothetical protein
MKYMNCPICSRAVSSQAAGIKQCPYCYHPLDVKVWKEETAKKVEKEKENEKEKIAEIIKNGCKTEKEKKKEKEKKEKEKKKRYATMSKPEILKEIIEKKDNEEKLQTITKNNLIRAYNIQKRTSGWNFYNENDIVQRTLETRFNFLLVAYTIFLTAYFSTEDVNNKLVILSIGLVIVFLLSLAISRTTKRFNITLDIVHSLEENDVSPIIHKENECRHGNWFDKKFRKNSIHGKFVPATMLITIVIGLVFNLTKPNGLKDLINLIKGVLK